MLTYPAHSCFEPLTISVLRDHCITSGSYVLPAAHFAHIYVSQSRNSQTAAPNVGSVCVQQPTMTVSRLKVLHYEGNCTACRHPRVAVRRPRAAYDLHVAMLHSADSSSASSGNFLKTSWSSAQILVIVVFVAILPVHNSDNRQHT